jgi:hypothetical protein
MSEEELIRKNFKNTKFLVRANHLENAILINKLRNKLEKSQSSTLAGSF